MSATPGLPVEVVLRSRGAQTRTETAPREPQADSLGLEPEGDYWLGSRWAPTHCAAIKGFARAGRLDVAREAALRHVQCMHEVLESTGCIWENYCSSSCGEPVTACRIAA